MTDSERLQPTSSYNLQVIGVIRSPYKEKFGIPRQPRLVDVQSSLELLPGFDLPAMVDGLEGFSHLWLTFVFHGCVAQGWKPRVRPPRLGGNERVGVYASRAPFRPNHLGLSVVELVGIEREGGLRLQLKGADLLDGTPVLDIKPYVPYVDAIPDARSGFAPEAPSSLTVTFSTEVEQQLASDPRLRQLIAAVLSQDPRPAYQQNDAERVYGMRLAEVNVRFRVQAGQAQVIAVEQVGEESPDITR